MLDTSSYFGKKIAILGCSVEGFDSAKFFTTEGAHVICCDRRTPELLGDQYHKLKALGVEFKLGSSYLEHLDSYDFLIRTPGMSPRLSELEKIRDQKIPITSSTNLFFEHCRGKIIGVTGTKGKGTTATLIYEMLTAAGRIVYLGGNVGIPLLSQVRSINENDWVVLELSSFQLEDVRYSPHIAVVLRITNDHLANFDQNATNYHPNRQSYITAKKSIVCFQKAGDFVVLNADDPISSSFGNETPAAKKYFSRVSHDCSAYVQNHRVYLRHNNISEQICHLDEIQLRGEHNLENIAAACVVSSLVGVSADTMRTVAQMFQPLEHHLELVARINQISYVDDSFSTVPETGIAALRSFTEPIVLIAGGSDKGSNYTELGLEVMVKNIRALILIGQMAKKIEFNVLEAARMLKKEISFPIILDCKNMQEIITAAIHWAKPGDVVLLSPACASFGMFANYKERGKLFKHYVAELKNNNTD